MMIWGFRVGDISNLEPGIEYIIVPKDKIEILEKRIKNLEAVIECQKKTIENQGIGNEEKHNILCDIKEEIDEYFGEC